MRFHSEAWMWASIHPVVIIAVPVIWIFSVYGLAHHMTTRRAVDVKSFMQVYNVIQIILCLYMVWGLMPCIRFPNIFGLNSAYDRQGEWFVYVHYLSKFLDWFDTLWIILKKNRKQLSFLHVYHHMTIPMVWGYLLHSGVGNGTIRYGAWVNSLTHVIMYSHYLWTSFGLENPFKRYITGWQITQFYSCLAHAFLVRMIEETECWHYAWLQIGYQISMVYLFTKKMSYVPSCTPDITSLPGKEELCTSRRYIIIRGQSFDVTEFDHPGGEHMMDLAIGRDATIMFEYAHLRSDRAEKRLATIPKGPSLSELEKAGYKMDRPNEQWATPGQSELYQTLKKRVVEEVLRPLGRADAPSGVRGVPAWHIASVLGTWIVAATIFISRPSIFSGAILGLSLAWIGLAIQHTASHGGLVKDPCLGYLLGLTNDLCAGGSSLVWRYHHQVSHHTYCNDPILDQDAHSSFPVLRMDKSQICLPFHRWQWLYGPILFCFLYGSIHIQDLQCLLDARSFLVHFKGTTSLEVVFAMVLKLVHASWFFFLPAAIHGGRTMLLPWFSAICVGSFWLSALFIVSHNLLATKEMEEPRAKACTNDAKGANSDNNAADWARYQIETSSSWGGVVGSFLTGGLNLQIEHHLFPCMAHNLYPQVQTIVREECAKRGIRYNWYPTLFPNFVDHINFLYAAGRPAWGRKSE